LSKLKVERNKGLNSITPPLETFHYFAGRRRDQGKRKAGEHPTSESWESKRKRRKKFRGARVKEG